MCRRTPGPATMASLSLSHPTSLVKCLGSVLISITPKGEVRLWNTCWAPEASHSQLSPHSPHTTPPTRGHRYHPPATLQGGIRTGKGFRPLGPGLQHSTGPATPASACPRHHSRVCCRHTAPFSWFQEVALPVGVGEFHPAVQAPPPTSFFFPTTVL